MSAERQASSRLVQLSVLTFQDLPSLLAGWLVKLLMEQVLHQMRRVSHRLQGFKQVATSLEPTPNASPFQASQVAQNFFHILIGKQRDVQTLQSQSTSKAHSIFFATKCRTYWYHQQTSYNLNCKMFISICLLNTPTLRRLLLVCFNIATCSSGSIHLAVFDFRCCTFELWISILHTSVALFALLPLGAAFCQTWILVPQRGKFFKKYWER